MTLIAQKNGYSIKDFIKIQNESDDLFEFIGGEIYLMGRASSEHGVLTGSLTGLLFSQLKNKSCKVIPESMGIRVKNDISDQVFRPDITVICDELEKGKSIVENPSLLIEVSSPSTEERDRTIKLMSYLSIDTLKAYLIVKRDIKEITLHRMVDGKYVRHIFRTGDIVKIDDWIKLSVDEVYSGIEDMN